MSYDQPMLYSISGTVKKLDLPYVAIDVNGVAYLATVPAPLWDELREGGEATLVLYTYVREDRLDLFGFKAKEDRAMFAEFLNISGIGPKTAMELCSIPKNILFAAAMEDDVSSLQKVKGIGKKTAEKLIVDLKQLLEKHPEWTALPKGSNEDSHAAFDDDAIGALLGLGYDRSTIVEALRKLPAKLTKTEERVTAVLRSL